MNANAFGFFFCFGRRIKRLKQLSEGQYHFSYALKDSLLIKSGGGFEFSNPESGILRQLKI